MGGHAFRRQNPSEKAAALAASTKQVKSKNAKLGEERGPTQTKAKAKKKR